MKYSKKLIRAGLLSVLIALGVAVASFANGGTNESIVAGYDPGGAADPPLPVDAPAVAFDPSVDIANVDASVIVSSGASVVRFSDGATGRQIGVVDINPAADLRAVSADGTLAALLEHRLGSEQLEERSIITVASRTDGVANSTYELDGLVEPEAFSTDRTILYVIDHQASNTPGAYRVRPLDLATGQLGVMLGPQKVPIPEEMNGRGRRQIWSPQGDRLYTLYIRQTVHIHTDGEDHPHGTGGTDGFVHVLDLNQEWAFCLHLPTGFGTGDLDQTAIALDPTGKELAILDLNAGQLAWASTVDLTVTEVLDLPADLVVDGEVHMAITQTHLAIGWGAEVHWFERDTLVETGAATALASTLKAMTTTGDQILAWTATVEQLAPPQAA